MFAGPLFCVSSLCTVVVLAKPLQLNPSASLSSSVVDAAFVSNISTGSSALNTTAENTFNIECDGNRYGFNPNIADCEGAVQTIAPEWETFVWGQRHTGLPAGTFTLPFAVFGDRAECAVRTVLVGDAPTARASLRQIKTAAAALSLQCVAGAESQGGIATNIGGDNNLAVIMSVYRPNIQCGRAEVFVDAPSCADIMVDMPASTEPILFGPHGTPGIVEPLPQLIASTDNKCLLRIFSTGRADLASWYSIWEAADATFAKCARFGRFGSFRGLGDHGNIFFALASIPSTASVGNTSLVEIE